MAPRETALIGGVATHYRVTIPLPLVDNDGKPFAGEDIDWFESMLLAVVLGWRKHHFVDGVWDGSGEVYREPVCVFETTIPREKLKPLVVILQEARVRFRQHALLVEVSAVEKLLLTDTDSAVEASA
jgi:hypothetical protein